MEIVKKVDGEKLTLSLSGRLDTNTAPQLEGELKDSLKNVKELVLDLKELEYVSSAGLRVLLSTQKTMNQQGTMVLENVCADIKEVFDITGFSDILTVR